MKKLTISVTPEETKWGWLYFAFQMTVLQVLLSAVNLYLGNILSAPGLNVLYYTVNFLCNIFIFLSFLKKSTRAAIKKPGLCLSSAALGFILYLIVSLIVSRLLQWLHPGFSNINDDTIVKMLRENPVLMTISVVCLVPPVEELVFRGLIFRPLYNRRPWLGYIVSAACFSLPHVLGYVGTHDPLVLLLCFFQYIPAGLCLGWAYARSQTIWSPILIHAAVNLSSVLIML